MKSISERALCEIEKRLKGVREEDGYSSNAGLHVFRARRSLSTDDLPALVIWDAGEQPTSSTTNGDLPSGTSVRILLTVNVEIAALASQKDTGFILEQLKADVKRALFGNGNVNGYLDDMESPAGKKVSIGELGYLGVQVFPREDGAVSESLTMKFGVRYVENIANPY